MLFFYFLSSYSWVIVNCQSMNVNYICKYHVLLWLSISIKEKYSFSFSFAFVSFCLVNQARYNHLTRTKTLYSINEWMNTLVSLFFRKRTKVISNWTFEAWEIFFLPFWAFFRKTRFKSILCISVRRILCQLFINLRIWNLILFIR